MNSSTRQSTAFTTLRQLFLGSKTGIVQVGGEGEGQAAERLFFISGDLYLEPDHPLALALPDAASEDGAADAASSRGTGVWLVQALDCFRGWAERQLVFSEGTAGVPSSVVGPLPLAALLMEAAVDGADEFQLLRHLGGSDREYVATARAAGGARVPLDPHEAFLLSRMEQPVAVKKLIHRPEIDRHTALVKLCRLEAVDLVQPRERASVERSSGLLDQKLLRRFGERIQADLEREPLELEPDEHRRRIADLLARLGGMTHYDLLRLPIGSSAEEIHGAYTRVGRLVHPSHGARLGLGGKEAGLQLLFERATEAYLTLSDQDRSARYLMEHGGQIEGADGRPTGEARQREVKALADEHFRTARAMVAREDFHFAIELLNQAIRINPLPQYYALLAECQERNPRWLGKAVATYGKAVQLAPDDADLRAALAAALEKAGRRSDAETQYRAALARHEGHAAAAAGLARLGRGGTRAQAADQGLWRRLIDRLQR